MKAHIRSYALGGSFILALSASPTVAGEPIPAPRLQLNADDVLVVLSLPDVLSREEVTPHLASGLTTSFVLEASVKDSRGKVTRGTGRIEIRYELWDEAYLVRSLGPSGVEAYDPLPSFDALRKAWQELRVPVAVAGSLDRTATPWTVEVALSIVPFSQAEQRDAQRWLTSAMSAPPVARLPPVGDLPGDASEGESSSAFDVFLSAGIQRQSLVRYDWTVKFRPDPQQ